MENNKAYLQNIHWVALLAVGSVGLTFLIPVLFPESVMTDRTRFQIVSFIITTVPFIGLGIALSKWREAIMAWACAMLIYILGDFVVKASGLPVRMFFYLIYPLPYLLFIVQVAGWNKRAFLLHPLCFMTVLIMYWTLGYTGRFIHMIGLENFFWSEAIFLALHVAAFIAQNLILCELVNFAKGKGNIKQDKLLNPGNEYTKLNGLIAYWSIKGAIWKLLLLFFDRVVAYMETFQSARGAYVSVYRRSGMLEFMYITGGINMILVIIGGLVIAWYLRKLALELFITYNIQSKFAYWLSILPGIGFLVLAVTILPATKQKNYSDRVNNIGRFASTETLSVAVLFGALLCLRFVPGLSSGGNINIVGTLLSLILFIWLIFDKTAFYVNIVINLACLVAGLVLIYTVRMDPKIVALLMCVVLLSTIQLIYIFPVFHFNQFEYTPAEEPGTEQGYYADGEFHLFPPIK